jgi:hypothetical protein
MALQLGSGAATGNNVSCYALAAFSLSESDMSVRCRTQKTPGSLDLGKVR